MKSTLFKTEAEINAAAEKGFEFVLMYKLSEIVIIDYSDFDKFDCEVTQARFFDGCKELRIFNYNGQLQGCLIEDEPDDVINKYERNIRIKSKFKKVIIKEYMDFDEDGQAYVKAVRLMSMK